jgi:hypothetical protein
MNQQIEATGYSMLSLEVESDEEEAWRSRSDACSCEAFHEHVGAISVG